MSSLKIVCKWRFVSCINVAFCQSFVTLLNNKHYILMILIYCLYLTYLIQVQPIAYDFDHVNKLCMSLKLIFSIMNFKYKFRMSHWNVSLNYNHFRTQLLLETKKNSYLNMLYIQNLLMVMLLSHSVFGLQKNLRQYKNSKLVIKQSI